MDNREIEFSLELLISAFKQNNILTTQISYGDILHISDLIQSNKDIEIDLLKEYDQVKKSEFEFRVVDKLEREINLQISSIDKTILSIEPKHTYYAFISDCLLIKYQYCYNRYIEISKHVRYREIPVYKIHQEDLKQIKSYLKNVSYNILKLRVLQKVRESFALVSIFDAQIPNHLKIKVKETIPDAVYELLIENEKLTIEDVLSRIKWEYRIKYYENNGRSEKENQILLNKNARLAYRRLRKKWGLEN